MVGADLCRDFPRAAVRGDGAGESCWFSESTPGSSGSPWLALINEGIAFLVLVVATWVMSRIEHKPVLSLRVPGAGARGAIYCRGWRGVFVAISVLVLSLEKLGYLAIDGRALGGAAALHFALIWAGVFVLVGFFEESLLRGYLQFTLTRGMGFWWGAILLSFLFGFGHGHNPGESPVGLFAAGAIGPGVLPEPLVHGVAVVGGRVPRGMGLG